MKTSTFKVVNEILKYYNKCSLHESEDHNS